MGQWLGNVRGRLMEDKGYSSRFVFQIHLRINSPSWVQKYSPLPGEGWAPFSWKVCVPLSDRKRGGWGALPAAADSQVLSAQNHMPKGHIWGSLLWFSLVNQKIHDTILLSLTDVHAQLWDPTPLLLNPLGNLLIRGLGFSSFIAYPITMTGM